MKTVVTETELASKIKNICPDELSNEYFVKRCKSIFCGIDDNIAEKRPFTKVEYEHYKLLSHDMHDMKIGDLIDYLKSNFRETDKICFMDYVQGLKNDCVYMTKEQLGTRFFRYAKSDESVEKTVVMI